MNRLHFPGAAHARPPSDPTARRFTWLDSDRIRRAHHAPCYGHPHRESMLLPTAPPVSLYCLYDGAFGNPGTTTSTGPTYHASCEGVVLNTAGSDFDVPGGSFDVFVAEGGNIDLRLRDTFTGDRASLGHSISLHMRVHVHGYLNWPAAAARSTG